MSLDLLIRATIQPFKIHGTGYAVVTARCREHYTGEVVAYYTDARTAATHADSIGCVVWSLASRELLRDKPMAESYNPVVLAPKPAPVVDTVDVFHDSVDDLNPRIAERKAAMTLTRMERVYHSTHEAPTGFAGLKRNIALLRDRKQRAEAWRQRDPLERPVPRTAYQVELDQRHTALMDKLIDEQRPLAAKLKRMAENARKRKSGGE